MTIFAYRAFKEIKLNEVIWVVPNQIALTSLKGEEKVSGVQVPKERGHVRIQ